MNRIYMLLLIVLICVLSCTKSKTTVNNYPLSANSSQPAFSINGLTNITLTNLFRVSTVLNLSVNYLDSAQEKVTLAVSGLPGGVVIDTGWVNSGIPSFNTTLTIYDTTITGAVPGTYPLTLTATTASGKKKYFGFDLKILPMPTTFLGEYDSCIMYCSGTFIYRDSVYADASVVNKIWFINYANSGQHVYGLISPGGIFTIPAQTIGGSTYTGGGELSAEHAINISISGSCGINMRDKP